MAMATGPRTIPPAEALDPNIVRREVTYEYSVDLAALLTAQKTSLLISTYQAGKLVVVGTHENDVALTFHNLDRPMGLALKPGCLAVGASNQVWFFREAPQVAPWLKPAGKFDTSFLTRSSHVTGDIRCHEMAWAEDELWIVNTLFSCL